MESILKNKLIKYLTLEGAFSIINGNDVWIVKHPIQTSQFFSMIEKQFEMQNDSPLLDILTDPNTVIHAGSLYRSEKGINLKTALSKMKEEIMRGIGTQEDIYREYDSIIKLYETLDLKDFVTLANEGISFCLYYNDLFAIKYLSSYIVKFDGKNWKFPSCTLGIYIDNQLRIGYDEGGVVFILKPDHYIHPFVSGGPPSAICLGSFYQSGDAKVVFELNFVNRLIMLFATTKQILVSGYDFDVEPANGHLNDELYDKYRI